ncbi:penicillin-binding protein 2 [Candidatus Peregrinibacteria bacterium]|nr:penicillin-binding protein 2 [Candidatus Peregrinibacteria bacterium]
MMTRASLHRSEVQKKRSLVRRMIVLHCIFLIVLLVIISRLMELQILKGAEYKAAAEERHYRKILVAAKRGEILGVNSKTGEKNIFATNTTIDLLYVDPLITDDPDSVANKLADLLLTPEFHDACSHGKETCPKELIPLYAVAFDPLLQQRILSSGSLLEPLPPGALPASLLHLPNLPEARRDFSAFIRRRVSEKRVTFVPLKYGATKVQMTAAAAMSIPGVTVDRHQNLIYANPEQVPQSFVSTFARALAGKLQIDGATIADALQSRPLRYAPILRKLPPSLSLRIREEQLAELQNALAKADPRKRGETQDLHYPLRSVALLPEHWRFYPDTTIASHVVGFVNTSQEPQYGIERTFNPQLRGQEGVISTVNDPQGGQILTAAQTIVDPKDGDTVVLTLDRAVQKELETLMQDAVTKYKADSGQAIVVDPFTGRILAMVNAPLFDSNNYADVYQKDVVRFDSATQKKLVVEVYNPERNARVVKAYKDEVFTESGRALLSLKTRKQIEDLEQLYDVRDLTRYYKYIGDNIRREVFPTDDPGVWLKFKNEIGVGAYLNRTVQEIYEPGSVMKPVTMAIALDQGEVTPDSTYDDTGPVQVDEYTIKNALLTSYGNVTMTNCLELSINTCLTSVGFKLGPKLLHDEMVRFGFGSITGIQLEDELPGEIRPWREWSRSLLATTAFGQGISVTPLQMVTAWAALANGGKLMKPTIIDSIEHADGTVEKTQPKVIDQVISPQASETITAMLVSSADRGFAKSGKVPGYTIAAKTGTSQIAGPGGKYEEGSGTTIATYAGYAPASHPKFLILIKIDRPKNTVFGVVAAAPVFKQMAKFLFDYYGIPPEEK